MIVNNNPNFMEMNEFINISYEYRSTSEQYNTMYQQNSASAETTKHNTYVKHNFPISYW